MNYEEYFVSLTDKQLDQMILNLQSGVDKVLVSEKLVLEKIIQKAKNEWESRHPGTICPSLYDKATKSGGFDFYYTGPRLTIELGEEE